MALELNFKGGGGDEKLMKWQKSASTNRSVVNEFLLHFFVEKMNFRKKLEVQESVKITPLV